MKNKGYLKLFITLSICFFSFTLFSWKANGQGIIITGGAQLVMENDVQLVVEDPGSSISIDLSSSLDASGTIHLKGSFHNQGAFDSKDGTIILSNTDGTPIIIEGENTFNNFIIEYGTSVQFEAGVTQTILQNLSLVGTDADSIDIASTMNGTQASLNVTGKDVKAQFINVRDIDISGGQIYSAYESLNKGNVTGFIFFDFIPPDYFYASDELEYGEIFLNWTTGSGHITGYKIFKNGIEIAQIDSALITNYTDSALNSGEINEYCLYPIYDSVIVSTSPLCDIGSTKPILYASDDDNDYYIKLNWELDPVLIPIAYNEQIYVQLVDSASDKEVYYNIIKKDSSKIQPKTNYFTPENILYFDGFNDISLSSLLISSNKQWTLECIVKKDKSDILNNNLVTGINFFISLVNENGNISVNGQEFDYQLPDDKWINLAFTSDGSQVTLYVNGIDSGDVNYSSPLSIHTLGQNFIGHIAELKIWDVQRNENDILNNLFTEYSIGTANLLAYWKLNEGDGTTIFDVQGNYNASVNQPYWAEIDHFDRRRIIMEDSLNHYIGPDKSIAYIMNLFQVGPGLPIDFPSTKDHGTTLPFQLPDFWKDDSVHFDRVKLFWKNNSALTTKFRIYRDSIIIAEVDSFTNSFEDIFALNDIKSLKSGMDYIYSLETYNEQFNKTYQKVELQAGTQDIGLEASDNEFEAKVRLNWNDLSDDFDTLQIIRDGSPMSLLTKGQTVFTDGHPVFGKRHNYGLIAIKNDRNFIAAFDTGSVAANGLIEGIVVTREGNYAVEGATIKLNTIIDGEEIEFTTTTSPTGEFEFQYIYYKREAQFELSAQLTNYSFDEPEKTIELNELQNKVINITFFSDKQFEVVTSEDNWLIDFQAVQIPENDKVQLTWDYNQQSIPVYFKIFREDQLLDIIYDASGKITSYDDYTGLPDRLYNYTIETYIMPDEKTVTEFALQDDEFFPVVATISPSNIQCIPNSNDGTVDVTWTHTSDNVSGYIIYRDSNLVTNINKYADFVFKDFGGNPSQSHDYGLQAYVVKDDKEFVSEINEITDIIYPVLPPIESASTNPVTDNDYLIVTWADSISDEYNFIGYRILRNSQKIGKVLKEYPDKFKDYTGIPGEDYTYSVSRYIENNNLLSTSAEVSAAGSYPALQAPYDLALTDSSTQYVNLGWKHQSENHKGFIIYRDTVAIDTIPPGKRSYTDVPSNNLSSSELSYTVKAYTFYDGQYYLSEPSNSVTTSIEAYTGTGYPEAPTVFNASDNYTNHIRLTWNYPLYLHAGFIIYRNGEKIDSLPYYERDYADYSVTPGVKYAYQVQAVYNTNYSPLIGDAGICLPAKIIEGIVKDGSQRGIPNARITAYVDTAQMQVPDEYLVKIITDYTGYYRIEDVPGINNINVKVTAECQNYTFKDSIKWVTINEVNHYRVDFIDESNKFPVISDEVAQIDTITLLADKIDKTVRIYWNTSNQNYSGFKITRGVGEIADIPGNNKLEYIDNGIAPGYTYNYEIKTYWNTPDGKQESEPVFGTVLVPGIFPVEYLMVVPVPDENKVRLSWSHPTDECSYYEIKRNDEIIGIVNTDDILKFDDADGLPGHLYTYTVTAILLKDGEPLRSMGNIGKVNYPDIYPVHNVTSDVPVDNSEIAGNTFIFNGIDEYVEITDSPSLNNYSTTNEITIEYWVNRTSNDEAHDIISKRDAGNIGGFVVEAPGSDLEVNHYVYLSGSWQHVSCPYELNEWTHIALTYSDTTGLKLYKNGELTDELAITGDLNVTTANMRIGCNTMNLNRFFHGKIDEVRIWDCNISQEQIQDNMYKTLNGNESGLLACYNFNEISGNILTDISGNGNDGTLQGIDATNLTESYAMVNPISDEFRNYLTLSWENEAVNFDGYTIYQDNQLIKTVTNIDTLQYKVYEGIPNTKHKYYIKAYEEIEGSIYESYADSVICIFPAVKNPVNFKAIPDVLKGNMVLSWDYPAIDGINGFYIYRSDNSEPIGIINDIAKYTFTDYTGVPEANYDYSIAAYQSKNKTYYSDTIYDIGVNYPVIPTPENFNIVYNFSSLTLNWDYEANCDYFNVYFIENRFNLYERNLYFAEGTREITISDHLFAHYEISLSIRAAKVIDEITYYSSWQTIDPVDNNQLGMYTNATYDNYSLYLNASDGLRNKVELTWDKDDDVNFDSYYIYKDGILINTIDNANVTSYLDYDVIPGKIYQYAILLMRNGTFYISTFYLDKGSAMANGKIKGRVLLDDYTTGVPGITLTAITQINGNTYYHTDTTNESGDYEIQNVYYEEDADVTVIASCKGHLFEEDTMYTSLDLDENIKYIDPFIDKTAFVITGRVFYAGLDIGLDSALITLETIKTTGMAPPKTAYSNEDGYYSVVINTMDQTIDKYKLKINQNRELGPLQDKDTLYHEFNPVAQEGLIYSIVTDSIEIMRNDIPGQKTVVDFVDSTAYPVTIKVQTPCGNIENRWFVNIRTKDGLYNNTIKTLGGGQRVINLPPLQYELKVVDVANVNNKLLAVIDYLRVRPDNIDLFSLHHDTLKGDMSTISEMQMNGDLDVAFTYHKIPTIDIGNIDNATYLYVEDLAIPVIDGDDDLITYGCNISVFEIHDGQSCPVNEGWLVIKNVASNNPSEVIIPYNKELIGFEKYEFISGDPNIINPYYQNFIIEFHTKTGGMLTDFIQPVIVTGTKSAPGNDILVDAMDEDKGQVILPLFILRDPPGDGSYSYIQAGSSFENKINISHDNKFANDFTISTGLKFFFAGTSTDIIVKTGGSTGSSKSLTLTTTLKESMYTSSASNLIGKQADVIVGVGMAVKYGFATKLYVDNNQIILTDIITYDPTSEVKTEWIYTVKQLEQLIKEYDIKIDSINAGSLIIEGLDTSAIDYYTSVQNNWRQILRYYNIETAPHVCFCTDFASRVKERKHIHSDLKGLYDSDIKDFCNQFGTMSGNWPDIVFNPDSLRSINFDWNQTNMDKFNDLLAVDYKLDDKDYVEGTIWNLFDQAEEEYSMLFGTEAKNITFGGGTQYAEELSASVTKKRGLTGTFYIGGGLKIKAKIETKVDLVQGVALGAMVGTITTAAETKFNFNNTFTYNFTENRSQEMTAGETSTVGYKLTDDDVGDQYSVTVVKGVAKNHTPYFSLVGGRTSCPTEDGAIPRDMPYITFENPDGSGFNNFVDHADPENPVLVPVKMANESPFGENRSFTLKPGTNSNIRGAILKVGGTILSATNFNLAGRDPFYTWLSVEKAPVYYQYPDLKLCLSASCGDGGKMKCIDLQVNFESPCSPVSILKPANNWVINKAPLENEEQLYIKLGDFSLSNPLLSSIKLQYRRMGSFSNDELYWQDIVEIPVDTLKAYWDEVKQPGQHPYYWYIWNITDKDHIVNGEYELRALAFCQGAGEIYSNSLFGIIDRTSLALFGNPEPADGLLSLGDEISISFNELIDCELIKNEDLKIINKNTGTEVDINYSCYQNKIIFTINESISSLDGDTLTALVSDITDISGNVLSDTIEWEFKVSYNTIYWLDNILSFNVYRDINDTITAKLENSGANNETYVISGFGNWLSGITTSGTINPSGRDISLIINSENLEVFGQYSDTIYAEISGFSSLPLIINVNVLPELPDWNVTHSDYSGNMNVIANFRIDSGDLSTDTMDMISIWIGSEIRGTAFIEPVSEDVYAAYITVSGDPEDAGQRLDFYIWDASDGIEYYGHPDDEIYFYLNTLYGSSVNPEELNIETYKDETRYIDIQNGWNWISFNTEVKDMSVNNILRNLKPAEGNLIKTQNSLSQYLPGTGWISLDGLDSVNIQSGYLLKVMNDDKLRISGLDAVPDVTILNAGWNLIGYPLQDALSPNIALNISNIADGDLIKNAISVADYNTNLGGWSGIDLLYPNEAYMIRVENYSLLNYKTTKKKSLSTSVSNSLKSIATWVVNPEDYEFNMTITCIATFNNSTINNNYKLAAFVNDTCRGTTNLIYVESLDKYIATMFIYSNTSNEQIEFRMFNPETGEILSATNHLTFVSDLNYGTLNNPFELKFVKGIDFNVTITDIMYTDLSGSCIGSASTVVSGGTSPLTYQWNDHAQQTTATATNLCEGEISVTVTDAMGNMTSTAAAILACPELTLSNIIGPDKVGKYEIATYSVTYHENSSYKWIVTGGNIISNQNSNAIEIQWGDNLSGEVSVTQYDEIGCNSNAVKLAISINPTSIQTADFENYCKVYPNPTSGKVNIELNNLDIDELWVEITDISGKKLFNKQFQYIPNQSCYELDLTDYTKGLYLLKIKTNKGIINEQLIIQ